MSRLERIRERLARLEKAGVLVHEDTRGDGPGRRWVIVPAGHAERVMSTSELETFMLGAETVQHVESVRKNQTVLDDMMRATIGA